MKLCLITDSHWGVKNDDPHMLEYFKMYYNDYFFHTVSAMGISHIVHLGDVFDRRKYINFSTLSQFNDIWIRNLIKYNLSVDHILGNHDTYFKSTNGVNAFKELFDLRYKDMAINFYDTPVEKYYDEVPILLFPWISENEEDKRIANEILDKTISKILFTHLDINGFIVNMGKLSETGYDISRFKNFFKVISGHYHLKQCNGNIEYLGAPYEMTWGDYNTMKGFHIFDTKTFKLEFIHNPHRLFYKLNYNDTINLKDDFSYLKNKFVRVVIRSSPNNTKFEKFINELTNVGVYDIEVVEDFNIIENVELLEENSSIDTIDVIEKYVKESTNISTKEKNDVISYMKDLYYKSTMVNTDG